MLDWVTTKEVLEEHGVLVANGKSASSFRCSHDLDVEKNGNVDLRERGSPS